MKKKNFIGPSLSFWIGGVFLAVFTLAYFLKVTQPNWIYTGDSLLNAGGYAFHGSGFARGEYPLWNPLVRFGQNEITLQMINRSSPISNLVYALSVFFHNPDMILAWATCVYVMIMIYSLGMAFLTTVLTKNCNAGFFALMVTLSSSTVFFSTYHDTFIVMLYSLPWLIYGLVKYFETLHFRYLLLSSLAFCVLLYSYECVMGVLYLFLFLCASLIFYWKDIPALWQRLKTIPQAHGLLAGGLMLFFLLPCLYMFYEYKADLLPISRASQISISDRYTLHYVQQFSRISFNPLLSKKFMSSLFTGFVFNDYSMLRNYLIPVVIPFLAVAFISFRKLSFTLGLAALGVCLLQGQVFPMSLFLQLPVFSSIRNLHFFSQYLLLSLILLAGLGFAMMAQQRFSQGKKVFNVAGILFFIFCLGLIIFINYGYRQQNLWALGVSIFFILALLAIVNFLPEQIRENAVLIVTAITAFSALAMVHQVPIISGGKSQRAELLSLRHRTDHSLKFLYDRPDAIQTVDFGDDREKWETDFGTDEYSSLLTLRDNSYAGKEANFGFASFPYLKSSYLFSLLPGHEVLLRKKFFFFERFFISREPSDMLAFKRDPNLFKEMVRKGVGMVSGPMAGPEPFSLGAFQPAILNQLPAATGEDPYSVTVKDYKANSIKLSVNVQRPGLFTYTDAWDKSWRVQVDGKSVPLQRVFYTLKGVILSPGAHEVKFSYQNKVIFLILSMNVVFWLGVVLFLVTEFGCRGSERSSLG